MCSLPARPRGLNPAVSPPPLSAGKDHRMHPLWMQRMFWLRAVFGHLVYFLLGIGAHPASICVLSKPPKQHCLYVSHLHQKQITGIFHPQPQLPLQGSVFGSLLLLTKGNKGEHTERGHIVLLTFFYSVFFFFF